MTRDMPYKLSVALLDVRSAHNVGAIFRTAEAAGVSKIYLVGYTPAPRDRFGRSNDSVSKTALGAETIVPWEQIENESVLIERLKGEGSAIISVEKTEDATPYKEYKLSGDTVFLFGNEIEGVSSEVIARSDKTIAIPMRGLKESLNVSVAAGIILYHFN